MVLIISEFSLMQSTLIPYSLINSHHKDINLDSDIDKNIRRFLSVMKKLNLNKINNNETNNKIWFYSKIPNNEIISLSNIKFNSKRQIEIINHDFLESHKENKSSISKITFDEIDNKEDNKENITKKENKEDKENIKELKNNNIDDINEEKDTYDIIGKNDLIKLFFSMPSIKEEKIRDFNRHENLEFEMLGKKRTREKENNYLNDSFEENLENTRKKTGPKRHSTFNISDYIG